MNTDSFIRSSKSFSDFFERAKSLTNKERGDVFERLVQLHLQSKPKYATSLKHVWQLNEVPSDVRKKLNLPDADEGIDLIAENTDGSFWAIQAKFRGNPTSRLSWGDKGGLSTFTSLAFTTCKNIDFCLVVATTEKPLRKTHLTGPKVAFELYDDLVELDDDGGKGWAALKSSLKGKAKPPKKLDPYPHQKRAINNAKKHFIKEKNTRGKLIMPCGTGKSLTGFWIAQALKAQEIVVAVPSLALIKQTLNTWTQEFLAHGIKPNWLAVCSDASAGQVDDDSFTAEIYEMGVPCETDPKIISKFLKQKSDAPRIVFTTYQSGKVLAEGAKKARHKFDLGIMDEAHKTVGRKDKVFAHLLDEKNIKIAKRIFMTATERFYRGNSTEIVSMDDPDLYGETFDLLTFRDAIEKFEIICGYRFVTVGIAQSEVTALWENNDYLRVEGAELDADTTRSLASGIALRKAYSELGVKRAISFHRSIKLASRFQKQQEQLAGAFTELAKVDCFHVSSKTSTGERNKQLRQFANAERGLITNARCLTEGVDIPSVDCVLFADPRQSKVDIVQAAGRAMRKAKGKPHGFIIVPMVVPDDVDLEVFAQDTAFANVVTIIKALAAEDERIVEYLRTIASGKIADNGIKIEAEFTEILAEKIDAHTLLHNVELKVWERVAKLNWRPFEAAVEFTRSLNLNGQSDWRDFASGRMPNMAPLPPDIPATPHAVYEKEWKGYGYWTGSGNVHPSKIKWMPFEKARAEVRKKEISSISEWKKLVAFRSGHQETHELSLDIPSHPEVAYKNSGWISWSDWLGSDYVPNNQRKYWPFNKAQEFVRSLKLRNSVEWRDYCSGKLLSLPEKPKEIPSAPHQIYKGKGWVDWNDWIGAGRTPGKWLSYADCQSVALSFGIKSKSEWLSRHSELVSISANGDIPRWPEDIYREKGWKSWADFLGTKRRIGGWAKFEEARCFARSLGLKGRMEWARYAKIGLEGKPDRPSDIPASPHYVYAKDGWQGWKDWLGN